ncbi:hypothetical protein [Nocardioides sp.]|uniref:hypothetical protein n=1 Tax=Nocardioides sp. TaxID=35761 RepID=UPI002ED953FE
MGTTTATRTAPSPGALYDATIGPAWRLGLALHRDPGRAEDAIARAYAALGEPLGEHWPADLHEGRVRVLAELTRQARRRAGATPAA